MGNAGLLELHEYGGDVHVPEHTVSVTRRIRADGTFAYSGQFRKNGNFQTFHRVPAHTVHIPERSIFRYTFHQNDYFRKEMAIRAKAVLNGTITVDEAMTLVGSRVRTKLRAAFTDGHLQPNADSTAKKKGAKRRHLSTRATCSRPSPLLPTSGEPVNEAKRSPGGDRAHESEVYRDALSG